MNVEMTKCLHCEKRFMSRTVLNIHCKILHSDLANLYSCRSCDFGNKSFESLDLHHAGKLGKCTPKRDLVSKLENEFNHVDKDLEVLFEVKTQAEPDSSVAGPSGQHPQTNETKGATNQEVEEMLFRAIAPFKEDIIAAVKKEMKNLEVKNSSQKE